MTDYITLLDCNRKQSAQYIGGNTESKALFTCKLGEGIKVNQGDTISVHNSFISETGSDDNAINFNDNLLEKRTITSTNIEYITPINGCNDKIYGYERVSASNIEEEIENKNNETYITYNYYKSANGENSVMLPRRWCYGIEGRPVQANWDLQDQIQTGRCYQQQVVAEIELPAITGQYLQQHFVDADYFYYQTGDSTLAGQENFFKLRNDNSRYTIFTQAFTLYGNQTAIDQYDFINASSDSPVNQTYIEYIEKLKISVDKGFSSPDAIADKITSQLTAQEQPKVNKFASNASWITGGAFPLITTNRPLNVELNSPTYHTFNAISEKTNNYDTWTAYNASYNSSYGLDYISSYQFIGVKRPELWKKGREFSEFARLRFNETAVGNNVQEVLTQSHQILEYELDHSEFDMNAVGQYTDLIITGWLWEGNDDLMRKWSEVFKEQYNYPELFENKNNIYAGYTPRETNRFFHMNIKYNASRPAYAGGLTTSQYLGWDYYDSNASQVEYLHTLPIFVDYDMEYENKRTNGESFTTGLNYGVFRRVRSRGGTADHIAFQCINRGNKMRLDYALLKPPLLNADITTIPNILFYKNNDDSNPRGTVAYTTNIGWDCHFNSYGNALLGLIDGWARDRYHTEAVGDMLPTGYNASQVESSKYSQKIYLGANEPKLNFNTTSQRFEWSDLHTAERVQNKYNAGGIDSASGTVVIPEFGTAGDKVYKVNKRLLGTSYTPDVLPYQQNDTDITIGTQTYDVNLLNQNLQGWTIYDQLCGIVIKDFGYTDKYWNEGIWGRLGFTYEQFNASRTSLNDLSNRVGNSNKFTLPYAFTNAEVSQIDTIDFVTNIFGAGMYNLSLPSTESFFDTNNASQEFRLNMYYENFLAVTESATSVKITAPNLPKKLNQGYYCIRSDVLDDNTFVGGQDSGQLFPVIAICQKSNDFGDFYSGGGGETFTFSKEKTITEITTSIHDPDQTLANVDDSSAVIYKLTRKLNPNRFNILDQVLENKK